MTWKIIRRSETLFIGHKRPSRRQIRLDFLVECGPWLVENDNQSPAQTFLRRTFKSVSEVGISIDVHGRACRSVST